MPTRWLFLYHDRGNPNLADLALPISFFDFKNKYPPEATPLSTAQVFFVVVIRPFPI